MKHVHQLKKMRSGMRSTQRGISFIGLIFVGGVLACAGVIAAQVFPTVVEYQAILKAANKSKEGNSVAEVRSIFDKAADIDNIKAIQGKDLDVVKEGDKIVVSFAYNREIHLTGPAFLVLKYAGRSK
jgi:beta-lactam-binding protein with PASTA domain